MSGLLIEGGAVVTVDDAGTIHDPGWVRVEGNRIVQVGAGDAPDSARRNVEDVISAAGWCRYAGDDQWPYPPVPDVLPWPGR